MSIENTLAERGARYGQFINHAEIAQGIQAVFHKMPNWSTLDYDMRQALVVISDKIARIGNGDPFYSDNWHDIMGYAKLVDDRLKELEKKASEDAKQHLINKEPDETLKPYFVQAPTTEVNHTYVTLKDFIVGERPSGYLFNRGISPDHVAAAKAKIANIFN